MKEFKGTRGPWYWDGDDIWNGDEMVTALIDGYQTDNVHKANAKLIAAAPELLEALTTLVYGHENKSGEDLFNIVVSGQEIQYALQAINKALGEDENGH